VILWCLFRTAIDFIAFAVDLQSSASPLRHEAIALIIASDVGRLERFSKWRKGHSEYLSLL
jgi:hypothetical protein